MSALNEAVPLRTYFLTGSWIIVNRLKCCYAIYGGGDELYYELRIQNPIRQDDYEQLILLIMCDEHSDIMSIISSDEVKAVVNDIRPE